jgi:tRNA (cmo5U34)-methyltransferase
LSLADSRYRRGTGDQFHFHPETYLELVRREVPAYDRLQDEVVNAARGLEPDRVLDLGVGTGVTSRRLLDDYPGVRLVGIDESEAMLGHARRALPSADFRVARLEDPLPGGRFELVISALAVHHLDASGKADLFRRVGAVLAPGGRFVLGDVIVPEDPADVVAPIDGEYDQPDSVDDQLTWLADAGLRSSLAWLDGDLAVMVGEQRPR